MIKKYFFAICWARIAFLLALSLAMFTVQAQTNPTWTGVLRGTTGSGISYGYGSSISVASDGSHYVTGPFSGTIALGGITLTAGAGAAHLFLAKFSAAGTILWATTLDGNQATLYGKVAADAVGNVYLAGRFATSVTFGSTTLTTAPNSIDAYLVKFNPQGVLQWARQGGASGTELGAVAVDASGNVAVAGHCNTPVTFGGAALSRNGIFYYKFSPNGAILQAQPVGTNGYPTCLAFDVAGIAYLGGEMVGYATFGSTTLTSTNANTTDIFICKLDAAGNNIWARRDGGVNYDAAQEIAVDVLGDVVVCGYQDNVVNTTASKAYVARYTSSGVQMWSRVINSSAGYAIASGVAHDGQGNYFITGTFSGSALFGTRRLNTLGYGLFLARYDSQGNVGWTDQSVVLTSSQSAAGKSIVADANGNLYLTGGAGGSVVFGPFTTTGNTNGDAFVARLNTRLAMAARSSRTIETLLVYPNPATSYTKLVCSANGGRLEIVDALGRLAYEQVLQPTANTHLVPLSRLSQGFYQLRVVLNSGQIAHTILSVQ